MKITIFGLTLSSSWGNGHATPYRAILRALHRRGHSITFYERDVEYYALRRDFLQCDFCNLVLYRTWDEIREPALRQCAESDVVITASYCPEGARINDEVLNLTRPLRVFYDLDTPLTLKNLPTQDLDYLRGEQLREFDLVLSWTGGKSLVELRTNWGVHLAFPLFGCVDPDVCRPAAIDSRFDCELSYMGTFAADRQQKVDNLLLEPARRRPDLAFVLAGTLYPWQWQWPENVRRFDHVSPADHPKLYSSSRLTLNITREEMAQTGWCPSGRFFEAAACGTPIVSDWWEGLDHFFQPGEEIFIVKRPDDVMNALATDEETLRTLAAKARARTLAENTGERRAEQLLQYLELARNSSPKSEDRKWALHNGDKDEFLEAVS